jgi:hypothetical protein
MPSATRAALPPSLLLDLLVLFLTGSCDNGLQASSSPSWKEHDPMVLEAVKVVSLVTVMHWLTCVEEPHEAAGPDSPTYVPVSDDWVL